MQLSRATVRLPTWNSRILDDLCHFPIAPRIQGLYTVHERVPRRPQVALVGVLLVLRVRGPRAEPMPVTVQIAAVGCPEKAAFRPQTSPWVKSTYGTTSPFLP